MYDVYSLCEMAFENELSYFEVKILKAMCKHMHFEIPSKEKLSQMVEDCSFMKE